MHEDPHQFRADESRRSRDKGDRRGRRLSCWQCEVRSNRRPLTTPGQRSYDARTSPPSCDGHWRWNNTNAYRVLSPADMLTGQGMEGTHVVINGLEGVVAATTRLSHVDGERGELVIAGFQIEELAEHATFEETTWLLWNGDLPSAAQLHTFREALAGTRALPASTVAVLRHCAQVRLD